VADLGFAAAAPDVPARGAALIVLPIRKKQPAPPKDEAPPAAKPDAPPAAADETLNVLKKQMEEMQAQIEKLAKR